MTITVNRAPVLTLWATVVAERMGFDTDEAHSLGRAVAGMNAQSKGQMLGIYTPGKTADGEPLPKTGLGEELWVELCGRSVPARRFQTGLRAVKKDEPVDPDKTRTYLKSRFKDALAPTREAMETLARSLDPEEIGSRAYGLYTRFRPEIPKGKTGWGARGELDLDLIRSLAERQGAKPVDGSQSGGLDS